MSKMKLTRIGENAWGHMAYQDTETGRYYLDLNYGVSETLDLHTCSPSDDMDGEPGFPVKWDYEIINPITEREKREKQYESQYMMLGRLIGDCRAYFGNGRGDESSDCRYQNECFIWGKDIKKLVAEMKRLWHVFPDDLKPQWVTWEEIEGYEKRTCSEEEERGPWQVKGIVWDTDGEDPEELDLPTEVEVPGDVDEDGIADWLSDEYGYCVYHYEMKYE